MESSTSQLRASQRELLGVLLRWAPQFGDYGQHDTQEFLLCLLDGLHQELNTITHKVYLRAIYIRMY